VLLAALLLNLQTTELPKINLAPSASGGEFIVEPFVVELEKAVQDALDVRARAKCGKLSVRWGKYVNSQETNPAAGGKFVTRYTQYRQMFSCYDPATDPYQPVPADWKPSAQDGKDLSAFLSRYVAALDRGDVEFVHASFEPIMEATSEQVRSLVSDFRMRAVPGGRVVKDPVWAANPEGAAHPGAYAYIAFSGPRSCGYFVVYRAGPGAFQLARQQAWGIPGSGPMTEIERGTLNEACGNI